MKQISKSLGLCLIVGLSLVTIPSCGDHEEADGVVTTGTQALTALPQEARTLIQGINGGSVHSTETLHALNTRGSKYEVYFNAEDVRLNIEFDANGHWTDIESESDGRAIPVSVLSRLGVNAHIISYLQSTYGIVAVEEIERLPYGYEVELLSGASLRFDRSGSLLTLAGNSGSHTNAGNGESICSGASAHSTALAFIHTHFSGYTVQLIKTEVEAGKTEYKYYISQGTQGYKIAFDQQYQWLEVEGDEYRRLYLPATILALLPQGIQTYLKANASGRSVVSVERGATQYELELSDGAEAHFTLGGDLLRIDY